MIFEPTIFVALTLIGFLFCDDTFTFFMVKNFYSVMTKTSAEVISEFCFGVEKRETTEHE
jgi:hypothetical protein